MKKLSFLTLALLFSGSVFAGAEHYLLRDGNHVYHLKVSKLANDTFVYADVDFEPSASEAGKKACSADISGEAKQVSENELVLKKHQDWDKSICTIQVHLTPNGAKVDQSEECKYFASGLCHFSSDGKELLKIK